LDKIGTAEMENEIVKNILAVTKKQSMQSAEQTGVGSSFEDEDIKEYLAQVVKETKRIR
jgi:azurin